MNKMRSLVILGSISFILLITLSVISWKPTILQQGDRSSQLLYPEFVDQISQIQKLEIAESEIQKFTIEHRKDEAGQSSWVWKDKHGYPVDPQPFVKLFNQIALLKAEESKTAIEHRHPVLGVGKLPKKNKDFKPAPRLIKIFVEGNKEPVVDLVIGKQRQTYNNFQLYVRKNSENQSWKTSSIEKLPVDYLDLIDRIILDVPKQDIEKISFFGEDKKELYHFSPAKDSEDFILSPIPKGQKVKSQFINNTFSTLFERVRFEDVRPLNKDEKLADPLRTLHVVKKDKLNYEVKLYYIDEVGMWFSLSAYSQDEKLNQAVEEFNKKHKKWLYKGSNWIQNKMLTKKEELYKKSE